MDMILWLLANKIFIPDEHGNLSPLTQNEAIQEITTSAPSPDLGVTFVKMLCTFAVLLLLLFGTYWLLKKLIRTRLEKGTGEKSIQILEKRMLSPKTMLYMIEVDGQKILIAESQLEVRPIVELQGKEPSC